MRANLFVLNRKAGSLVIFALLGFTLSGCQKPSFATADLSANTPGSTTDVNGGTTQGVVPSLGDIPAGSALCPSGGVPGGDFIASVQPNMIYHSDGAGNYCAWKNWNAFLQSGGAADMSSVSKLTNFPQTCMKYGGICGAPPPATAATTGAAPAAAPAAITPGPTVVTGTAPAAPAVPSSTNVSDPGPVDSGSPATTKGPCLTGPVSEGSFMAAAKPGTIYYSNGTGDYCAWNSWYGFLAHGGSADLSGVQQLDQFPRNCMAYDGVCKPNQQ